VPALVVAGLVALWGRPGWTGPAGSDRHALWWDEDGVRRARTPPSTMPCAPTSTVSSPRHEHVERIDGR
jgi:hypothetical protein